MAKILVSYYRSDEKSAGATLCYFDSFFQELKNCGNEVLAINNAYFGIFNPNTTKDKQIEEYLLAKAKQFDPDLIITFYHRILQSILDAFDVPIVIYDGDELRFFSDLDVIKRDIDRYKVFSIVEDWRRDYLDFGFKDDQIFYMPSGTAIRSDPSIKQNKQISFLGQRRFFLSTKLKRYISEGKNQDLFYEIYLDFLKTGNYSYDELFKKHVGRFTDISMDDADLWPLFDQSYLVFAALLDLDLHIGGHAGHWKDIVEFVPQLALVHDTSRVFTLEENQNFYNSSVLSLCPMHPQAKGKGFSWRCFDIMASNACLVSSYSSELQKSLQGYVDLPMFNTPYEAREICQKLLKDDGLRLDLVQASQEYVDKNCRWESRFEQMEEILGIPLVKAEEGENQARVKKLPALKTDSLQDSEKKKKQKTPREKASLFCKKIYGRISSIRFLLVMLSLLSSSAVLWAAINVLNVESMAFIGDLAAVFAVASAAVLEVVAVLVVLYRIFRYPRKKKNALVRKINRRKLVRMSNAYDLVYMPQGLGDILFFCMHASRYKDGLADKKLAMVVIKPHYKELVDLFEDSFDKVLYLRNYKDDGLSGLDNFYPKVYDEDNPQEHLHDAVLEAMGLGRGDEARIPQVPISEDDRKKYLAMGLVPGKTVLISPEATSCASVLTKKDWLEIADSYTSNGWKVFFNVDESSAYGEYPSAFLSIKETIQFCNLGGAFVGYRSGLCDVIAAFCKCRLVIAYPDNKKRNEHPSIKGYKQAPNEKYMEYCSLKRLFPEKEIIEFIIGDDSLKDALPKCK